MKILVKFPTLRPEKAREVIDKLAQLATTSGWYIFYDNTTSGKIAACNSKIDEWSRPWDILILMSDDMIPQVKGWDEIIISDMIKYYPDTDGVLHYNDGYMGKKLNTLCILGRKYYDRFGYIYHPSYQSLFADDEFQKVSEGLGKATYIDRVIIKHEHPFWNKTVKEDELYKKNNSYYLADKAVYEKRKALNFDLDKYKIII